jgi:hypothetical protein
MNRYQLMHHEQISPTFICEECHEWYHIELRRYHDNSNIDALHETSVRTSCACTPEVDPFVEANSNQVVFTDVSRGIPKPKISIDRRTKQATEYKTIVDDILQHDETS